MKKTVCSLLFVGVTFAVYSVMATTCTEFCVPNGRYCTQSNVPIPETCTPAEGGDPAGFCNAYQASLSQGFTGQKAIQAAQNINGC